MSEDRNSDDQEWAGVSPDELKNISRSAFSTVDVFLFVMVLIPLIFILQILGVEEGPFRTNLLFVVAFPAFIFYKTVLKPLLMQKKWVQKIVPDQVNPEGFSLFGLFSAFFSYVGALVVVFAFYFGLKDSVPKAEIHENEVEVVLNSESKYDELNAQMQRFVSAQKMEEGEVDESNIISAEDSEAQLKKELVEKRENRRHEIRQRLEQERKEEIANFKKEKLKEIVAGVSFGLVLLLIGLILDHVRAYLYRKKS